MNKVYWWAKIKETKKVWKSLKDELMYLIDNRVTFRLNLISSLNDEIPCIYLFNSNSTYSDFYDYIVLKNNYNNYNNRSYLTHSDSESFGSRLKGTNYTIDILTNEEFNKLIQ